MRGKRRIAMVAPPWYPVPPVGYGGIELVVDLLVSALRRQGVEVILYGAAGSRAGTVELAPAGWANDLGHTFHEHREVTYLARVLEDLTGRDVDLVHDHSGLVSPLVFAQRGEAPTLHTVHGPLTEPYRTLYESLGSLVGLVAISADQRASAPDLNWVGAVHNAIDVDSLVVGGPEDIEGYLLCLARISPEKGQHMAIEVARRCGKPLVLAGKVGEKDEERRYFREQIEPHIDDRNVIYVHNVAGVNKARVLSRADALLAPLQWREPFGLFMAEAMASGTPVIATRRGSAPELVTHGQTGFLSDDADEMVAAVGRLREIDRLNCAALARDAFSPHRMASRYTDLYEVILAGEQPQMELTGTSTPSVTLEQAGRTDEDLTLELTPA